MIQSNPIDIETRLLMRFCKLQIWRDARYIADHVWPLVSLGSLQNCFLEGFFGTLQISGWLERFMFDHSLVLCLGTKQNLGSGTSTDVHMMGMSQGLRIEVT